MKHYSLLLLIVLLSACSAPRLDDMMSYKDMIAVMDTVYQSYGYDIPSYYNITPNRLYRYAQIDQYKSDLKKAIAASKRCSVDSLQPVRKSVIESSYKLRRQHLALSGSAGSVASFGENNSLKLRYSSDFDHALHPEEAIFTIKRAYVERDGEKVGVEVQNLQWKADKKTPPFTYELSFEFNYDGKRYKLTNTCKKGKRIKPKYPFYYRWSVKTDQKVEEL